MARQARGRRRHKAFVWGDMTRKDGRDNLGFAFNSRALVAVSSAVAKDLNSVERRYVIRAGPRCRQANGIAHVVRVEPVGRRETLVKPMCRNDVGLCFVQPESAR